MRRRRRGWPTMTTRMCGRGRSVGRRKAVAGGRLRTTVRVREGDTVLELRSDDETILENGGDDVRWTARTQATHLSRASRFVPSPPPPLLSPPDPPHPPLPGPRLYKAGRPAPASTPLPPLQTYPLPSSLPPRTTPLSPCLSIHSVASSPPPLPPCLLGQLSRKNVPRPHPPPPPVYCWN